LKDPHHSHCRFVILQGHKYPWCSVHHAPWPHVDSERLCLRTAGSLGESKPDNLLVTIRDHPDGLSIWGTVTPVYDSTFSPISPGLHLHIAGEKNTHHEHNCWELYVRPDSVSKYQRLTYAAASSYVASAMFERPMITINCPHCRAPHLDLDQWSVHASRDHYCANCESAFKTPTECISNPLIEIKASLGDHLVVRVTEQTERSLSLVRRDYPGGIRIWGSNPAVIWTFRNPEKVGIHVHCFAEHNSPPIIDRTVRTLDIDGIDVDSYMVRAFMAQQMLPYLLPYLTVLHCPVCGSAHFDTGDNALLPHLRHTCASCSARFLASVPPYVCVSNPIIETMKQLLAC